MHLESSVEENALFFSSYGALRALSILPRLVAPMATDCNIQFYEFVSVNYQIANPFCAKEQIKELTPNVSPAVLSL